MSTEGFANVRPESLTHVKFQETGGMDDGYKSFDTFGGDKAKESTQNARYGTLS